MATFPTFVGLGFDIKKRPTFSTSNELSAAGTSYRTSRWVIPHYEFDVQVNYFSQTDRDTFEAFFNQQLGSAIPFLLNVTNDNSQTAKSFGTGDGTTVAFQLPIPARTGVLTFALFDNGSAAGTATVSASGVVTFGVAPLTAHALTWTGTYAYVVQFKDDIVEINQMLSQMYEAPTVLFRTVADTPVIATQPAPTITSFSPTSGAVGSSVVITGTNFTGATAVTFGGVNAPTFTVNSATQITVTVPASAATGTVTVTTPGGTATSGATFTVSSAAPTITSFAPTSGAVGASVVITGTNFTGATAVTFGGVNAPTFTVNSATQITATVPASAATGTIAVTTPGGTATSAGTFTVVAVPTITSFAPTSGAVASSVVITGTAFTGATAVTFNSVNAPTFTVNSATQITVTVPASATTGTIAVTTPGGTATSSGTFTVTTAFTPANLFLASEQGFWLDPSDFSTMWQNTAGTTAVTATGQSVARINDKSGNGYYFTQATTANMPTLQQDAGGKYYLSFNGSSMVLTSATAVNMSTNGQAYICAGMYLNSGSAAGGLLEVNGYGANSVNILWASASGYIRTDLLGTTGTSKQATSALTLPINNVLSVSCDLSQASSSTQIVYRRNAASDSGSSVASATLTGSSLGNTAAVIGEWVPGGSYWNGRIYGLILRNKINSTDIANTETWMDTKSGSY